MKVKSIKQKIAYRVILIGIITLVLSLILSYFVFVPNLKKNAIKTSEQINTKIIQQIDTLNSFVEDYTENLVLAVENNEKIFNYFNNPTEQNRNIASLNLNNLISNKGVARCVFISSDIAPMLDSLSNITETDYKLLDSELFKKLQSAKYGHGFSSVYKNELASNYYTAAYLKNFHIANRRFTYVVFFGLNNLIHDANVISANKLDYYALVDTNNNIFYTNGDEKLQDIVLKNVESRSVNSHENIDGGICFMNSSINSKWKVVSFVSNETIFQYYSNYVLSLVLVLLVFLILLLVSLFKSTTHILKPISNLSHNMEQVAHGNLDCQVEVISKDEIGRLSESFNTMILDLKHSMEIIAEKEKRENQAKFSLLVSQIDPHFIYNTINSINYLARKGRCDAIITVNSALIYILRDRLRVNDIQISDTIANEMKVLNQYIVIQKYMYDGDLQVRWQVDDELLTEQIPKNMIQPLVENSLFHGLIDEESGDLFGEIEIRIEKVNGNIVVKVKDNGLGMDKEKLEQVRKETYRPEDRGKKIGLSNIRGRLYYLYGNRDCIEIESEPNKGTCITLIFKEDNVNKI